MKKKDFVTRVADTLRENGVRKRVKIKKHTFTVTDMEGNSANFDVRRSDRMIPYSIDDVLSIIDACIEVVKKAMQNGEEICIKGIGTLGVVKRAASANKNFTTGERCEIPAHYVPKFNISPELRTAVKIYDLSLADREAGKRLHQLRDTYDEDVSEPVDTDGTEGSV